MHGPAGGLTLANGEGRTIRSHPPVYGFLPGPYLSDPRGHEFPFGLDGRVNWRLGVECGFFPRPWELKYLSVPSAKKPLPRNWFPSPHLAWLPAQHALPFGSYCACVQTHIHYGKEGPLMWRKL